MSLNRFRTKIKKLGKGHDKNSCDPNLIKPPASSNSASGLLAPKENKRKAISVSSPPDVGSSPVHMVSISSLWYLQATFLH